MINGLNKYFSIKWMNIFLLFILLGFVSPSLPFWSFIFYVIFVPLFLYFFLLRRHILVWKGLFCIVPFFIWGGISFVWSPTYRGAMDYICTSVFVLGGVQAFSHDPERFLKAFKKIWIYGATLNSGVALLKVLIGWGVAGRLGGIGMLHGILASAAIASIALILLCDDIKRCGAVRRGVLFPLIILPIFVMLTGGRMPLLALCAASSLVMIGVPRRIVVKSIICLGGSLLGGCVLFEGRIREVIQTSVERKDSFHKEIWLSVGRAIRDEPIWGHGLGAPVNVVVDGHSFAHAHNMYLEVLYQEGIIGGGCFVLMISSFFILAIKRRDLTILALLVFSLSVGMTDLSLIMKGPAETWYIMWGVFLLAMAASYKERIKEKSFIVQGGC